MYQAGVKNIKLYENINIEYWNYDPLNIFAITDITSGGAIITIENYQHPEFEIDYGFINGQLAEDYTLSFFLLGFYNDNVSLLEQIKTSIYGWCFLVEFYDGTSKFFKAPVFSGDTKIKPHEEMSFKLELKTAVPSAKRHYEFTEGVSTTPIYRADTTILKADTTIYTADYSL